MDAIDDRQLAALAAAVEEGSFDAAARRLQVTPSAVSQRIKALERRVGQVLVLRSRPCRATEAGQVLVRLAGQTALLHSEALAEVTGRGDTLRLAVAVNADSLSTWFPRVLEGLPEGVVVDLQREDQDHSAALLRDGSVMAAVTANARAVQGCRVEALGAMRYRAVAAPDYYARWFGSGVHAALGTAPVLAFNRKDALQQRFVQQVTGRRLRSPVHYAPSSWAYVELVRQGLGWGMVPEVMAREAIEEGRLVLVDRGHLDVPLYWQHWRLEAPALRDLTDRVSRTARTVLHAVGGRPRPTGVF